jgi:hypothetical protein
VDDFTWPPEVRAYNNNFTKALTVIKRRHDPVVTTMGSYSHFYSYANIQPKEFWNIKNKDNVPKSILKFNPS